MHPSEVLWCLDMLEAMFEMIVSNQTEENEGEWINEYQKAMGDTTTDKA